MSLVLKMLLNSLGGEIANFHGNCVWIFSDYRSDRRLFLDDVDIKFSRTLNSCKVPQVCLQHWSSLKICYFKNVLGFRVSF